LIARVAFGAVVIELSALFPQLYQFGYNEIIVTITDRGILFLMLFDSIEMPPHRMLAHSAGVLAVTIGRILVSLGLGLALGWYFLPKKRVAHRPMSFPGHRVGDHRRGLNRADPGGNRTTGDDEWPNTYLRGPLQRYPRSPNPRLADRIVFGGIDARP
jgi:hypothetical protein